jgi:hypothetical protein
VGELLQNRKHVFELGLGKVCFDGLCPKLSALLSSNVWVLVTVRLSKQTQLQGSIEIVHASNIIDAHATVNNIFHIQILVFSTWSV